MTQKFRWAASIVSSNLKIGFSGGGEFCPSISSISCIVLLGQVALAPVLVAVSGVDGGGDKVRSRGVCGD